MVGFVLMVLILIYYGLQGFAGGEDEFQWWPAGNTNPLMRILLQFKVIIFSMGCQFQLMSIFQELLLGRCNARRSEPLNQDRTDAGTTVRSQSITWFFPVTI